MIKRFFYSLITLALLVHLTPGARAAVAFTVTPASVSNTYNGRVTLQVTGLTGGDTVVVQKYLDANTNGIIDGRDILWQQFNLTDGQASVFHDGGTVVTNFNVPGDVDTTATQITTPLNFQNGDFSQNIVGKYLYKLSSPAGHFTAITNLFTVTNFAYAQSFTGTIFSNNTAAVVSNAVILLFQPSGNNGLNPVSGAVANNAGSYTIKAPPGTYLLAAFRSNYLVNLTASPTLVLGSGSTITTNLTLTNATQSISGKIADSNTPAIGLPGFLVPMESTNNFLAIGFTDTNGNFTAGTRPNVWKIQSNDQALTTHGYVAAQNSIKTNTAGGSVSGITNALPKATAIFYGSVKDELGNPLAGIDIGSSDNNNQYQSDSHTDTNGNYVAGALAADWHVGINSDGSPVNYVFSQGLDTTLTNGQAQLCNFTAIRATNHITGHIQDSNGNAIANVGISANATINGTNYQTLSADADAGGNYSLLVPNGSWNVNVNCNGGDDSLDGILGNGNYTCPNSQNINIAGSNATNNIIVQLCGGISITTSSPLPVGEVGVSYSQFVQASSCNNSLTWSFVSGSPPAGLTGNPSSGEIFGIPTVAGTSNFTFQVTDGVNTTNKQFSLTINSAVQITTASLPNGTNGTSYSEQLQASAGVPFGGSSPYSWSLSSGNLPGSLNLATNGLLSGPLTASGTFNFTVEVTDSLGGVSDQPLSLNIITTNLPTLTVGTGSGQIIVLWPASAGTNFTLQTTTNLATGPWVPATNGVPAISILFSNTGSAQFFRLQ